MTLPREVRIVVGFAMLVVAVWVWLQVFSVAPNLGVNTRLMSLVTAVPVSQVAPVAPGDQDAPDAVVTREVQIEVLPFIEEAPTVAGQPVAPEAQDEPSDEAEGAAQTTGRGAAVNPFTPVLAPEVEAAPEAPAAPQQVQPQRDPQVEVVEVPSAPPGQEQPVEPAIPDVRAPIPNAVTPPSPQARPLPRVLPSAALPGTPRVMQTALGSRNPSSEDVIRAAALSIPGAPPPTRVNFANQPRSTTGVSAVGTLSRRDSIASARTAPDATPLNFAARRRAEAAAQAAQAAPAAPAAPETLSSYLSSNGIQFTGTVLGPTNVGVFRAASGRTFVVPLGQTFPNTDIRLTSLQGQQAVLVRGGEQATLQLNSGR